ncbi:hypothetical protein LP420_31735 [Massilia sp. B-10]|nr:hypothetical protein LP420_31735 [Massilia sp. B-10]
MRLAHCRENPGQLLTDWVEDHEPGKLVRHEVQRQLDLVAKHRLGIGHMRPVVRGARGRPVTRAAPFRRTRHQRPAAHRGHAPGRERSHAAISIALWAEVIGGLWQRGGYTIVLTGELHERDLIDDIRERCRAPVYSLAGQLNLGQLGAVIRLRAWWCRTTRARRTWRRRSEHRWSSCMR